MWRGRAAPLAARWASSHVPRDVGFAGMGPGMCEPRDWQRAGREAVAQCDALVGEVVRSPPTVAVVALLDEISDTLCRVLDAAEFCRNVHVDREWRQAAQQACVDLGGYVQQLNTHYGLYSALARALQQHDAAAAAAAAARGPGGGGAAGAAGWDAEAVLVGRMLQRDFERYGVHLEGGRRDRMTSLVATAHGLGMAFTHNVLDPAQLGSLELRGELAGAAADLPDPVRKLLRPLRAPGGDGRVAGLACPAESAPLHAVLRGAGHAGLRRAAYEAYHQRPAANLAVLDALVEARHEVAQLMGFDSFAAYQLDAFSLAHRPAAVAAFLGRFAAAIAPKCVQEAGEMAALMGRLAGGGGGAPPAVQPWDRHYAQEAARGAGEAQALAALPAYFELERVVEGLSELLARSMGVRLAEDREAPLGAAEGWAPGVRKLAAFHETDGFLGVVYLDLYRRPDKFPSAAHFTLRCGRALPDGSYQTPVVALVANMAHGSGLSLGEVEMLFHEFGHALNSLLSRTRFQHLSGTRGPLDLVEVPSHTLELFASDPRVLALFARHAGSGEALPPALLGAAQAARRRWVGLEQQSQLQFCLIDQLLHGPDPPTGAAAQHAVAAIARRHSTLGHAEGCHPHLRFTHLVGYGATYYSYLYAQCLAAEIWRDHLAPDPLARGAGELLRHRLLEPGGARDAHSMVQELLSAGGGGGDHGRGGGGGGGLCEAGGGWYPDPQAMLLQQHLLPQ